MKKSISEFRLYLCNNWINCIPSHTIRLLYYRKVMKFQLGKDTTVLMHCVFDAAEGLVIGGNSVINARCRIDTRGGIRIGCNVSISSDVILLTGDHDMDHNMEGRARPLDICDYVWIGTRAMLMPGIKIAKASVIAAGAVVTKDTEESSVVAGVPAKEIKKRSDSLNYVALYKRL